FAVPAASLAPAYLLASAIPRLFDGAGFEAVFTDVIVALRCSGLRYTLQRTGAPVSGSHALDTPSHLRESVFQPYFYHHDSLNFGTCSSIQLRIYLRDMH